MKYIEYVYLALTGMVLVFLATDYEDLPRRTVIYLLLAMGIFSFMFAFRRRQRIQFERYEEEEMRKLAETEDGEEDTEDPNKAADEPQPPTR